MAVHEAQSGDNQQMRYLMGCPCDPGPVASSALRKICTPGEEDRRGDGSRAEARSHLLSCRRQCIYERVEPAGGIEQRDSLRTARDPGERRRLVIYSRSRHGKNILKSVCSERGEAIDSRHLAVV